MRSSILSKLSICLFILIGTGIQTVAAQATAGSVQSFKGTIDKYPISLQLHLAGGEYIGSYMYDRVGEPIDFSGIKKDGIILLTSYKGVQVETFRLREDAEGLTGSWQNGEKGAELSVALKRWKDGIPMQVKYLKDSIHPVADIRDVNGMFEGSAVWPTGSTAKDEFIRQEIRSCINPTKKSTASVDRLLAEKKSEFFAGLLEAVKSESAADLRDMASRLSWSMAKRVSVGWQSPSILCLNNMEWEYTGGAHGNGATLYKVLDLVNRKVLKVSDILNPAGIKALPKLLEKNLRRQSGIKSNQPLRDAGLYENRIEKVSEFFHLTNKVMIFSYTPYDIGPYSSGQIEIPVPFTELKPYLQPAFVKLAGL